PRPPHARIDPSASAEPPPLKLPRRAAKRPFERNSYGWPVHSAHAKRWTWITAVPPTKDARANTTPLSEETASVGTKPSGIEPVRSRRVHVTFAPSATQRKEPARV